MIFNGEMKEFNELLLKSVLFLGEIPLDEVVEGEHGAPVCCPNWHTYCTKKIAMPPKKKSPSKKAAVKKTAAKKVAKKATKKVAKKAVKKVAKKVTKKAAKKVAKKAGKKAAKVTKKATKAAAQKTSTPSPVIVETPREISHHEIEVAAFFIYQQRASEGRWGNQDSDWLEAEASLQQAS